MTATQLEVLRAVSKKSLPRNPTARDALLAVAALGGHIKNNGDFGWLVLDRGLHDLLLLEMVASRRRELLNRERARQKTASPVLAGGAFVCFGPVSLASVQILSAEDPLGCPTPWKPERRRACYASAVFTTLRSS